MKISETLKLAKEELKNSPTTDLDAEVLLSFVLKKDKSYLFAHPEKILSPSQKTKIQNLIKKRKKHWPIAYLLGKKEFFGLDFFINKNVLIPRPETEKLVDQTLRYIQKLVTSHKSPITILDLSTGSGCIAIAIAKNTKIPLKIIASDICNKALKVAEKNARYHKTKIKFIQSNLLQKIKIKPDIIVANLPYITPRIYKKLVPEITRYEPEKALLAKTRNYFYEKLKQELKKRNWKPKLFFE